MPPAVDSGRSGREHEAMNYSKLVYRGRVCVGLMMVVGSIILAIGSTRDADALPTGFLAITGSIGALLVGLAMTSQSKG